MKYLLILLILASTSAFAEISVGTKVSEPFVIQDDSGYYGISISLLDRLMLNIGETYNIKETDVLNELKNRKIDLGIYNMSITSDREKYIDFTTPYYTTNLAYAYKKEKSSVFSILWNKEFLVIFLILIGSILFVALLMKLLGEMTFGTGTWFATVTATTVGYGDKTVSSLIARLVIVVWMFTSLIIVSSFTATLSSSMVIDYVEQDVDLTNKIVGVVYNSTGNQYYGKIAKQYINQKHLIHALENKEVDVIIYDEASLQYCLGKKYAIQSIPNTSQFYSIGVLNKELQERINIELPKIIKSKWWLLELNKYKEKV